MESSLENKQVKHFLKAIPLVNLNDIDLIKSEVDEGNIVILKITPLAKKDIDDLKETVNKLKDYILRIGGDIARLGEERIILTPAKIKIWRS